MNIFNSKLYTFIENLSHLIILNVVWLISCIPIITIFPATTAMFSIVRRWQMYGDPGIFKHYFREFRKNFKQSFFIGGVWLVAAAILYIDFAFVLQLESNLSAILFGFFFILSFLFVCTTAFIFPVLVNYQASWKQAIFNSFLMSMAYFPTTLSVIGLTIMLAMIAYVIPLTALFTFSLAAYINYAFCKRNFKSVNDIKGVGASKSIERESEIT